MLFFSGFLISAKEMKYRTWKFAISKCMAWQGIQYDSSFKDFVYEDRGNFHSYINEEKIKSIP